MKIKSPKKSPNWTHSCLTQPSQSLKPLVQNVQFHIFIFMRALV